MTGRWKWAWAGVVAVGLATTAYGDVRAVDHIKTKPDSTSTSTWPHTIPSSEGFNQADVTIVKGARNAASDLSFRVTFPAARDQESYLFMDCDSGTFNINDELTGPCLGRVTGAMGTGSQPDAVTLTVRVSVSQKRSWGIAYYR